MSVILTDIGELNGYSVRHCLMCGKWHPYDCNSRHDPEKSLIFLPFDIFEVRR
jgi:hypothetical protein